MATAQSVAALVHTSAACATAPTNQVSRSGRGCPRAHVSSVEDLKEFWSATTSAVTAWIGSRSAFATEATTAAAQTGAARVHTSAALQRLPRHVMGSQRAKDGWRDRVDEHIASPHQSAPRRAAHVAIRKPPGRTANPASLSPLALQVALGGVREGMAALATAAAAHRAPNNRWRTPTDTHILGCGWRFRPRGLYEMATVSGPLPGLAVCCPRSDPESRQGRPITQPASAPLRCRSWAAWRTACTALGSPRGLAGEEPFSKEAAHFHGQLR